MLKEKKESSICSSMPNCVQNALQDVRLEIDFLLKYPFHIALLF